MFKTPFKQRPKHLVAIYVEELQVELLRAHRQWRNWQIESTEVLPIAEGDNLFDFLQRLNIRPRDKRSTALVLFLPRTYYSFHRELYPVSLKDRLDEVLTFDWQDNVFYESDHTLHFAGPAVTVDHHLSVPIFTIQQDIYDKLNQALGAGLFRTFAVIPSALAYKAFSSSPPPDDDCPPIQFFGRIIDRRHIEIHRFYNGSLLDSTVLGNSLGNLNLFLENVYSLGNGPCAERFNIRIVCTDAERAQDCGDEWKQKNLPCEYLALQDPLLSHWVKHLLELEQIQTFDAPLLLKPRQVPKALWPLLALVGLYSVFGLYAVYSFGHLQENSKLLKKQVANLETQWKPIEQLQGRIDKFQEDKKTLSQFHAEGYPLMEILTILTRITPDDTWLNYLSLRKGQLILRGESKSAIKYLPELSKVEGFTDVRFASPVTRNPTSDEERFNVQLQIDMEKFKNTMASLPKESTAEVSGSESTEATSEVGVNEGQEGQEEVDEEPPPDEEEVLPDEELISPEDEAIERGESPTGESQQGR